jgi:hypothetical protein
MRGAFIRMDGLRAFYPGHSFAEFLGKAEGRPGIQLSPSPKPENRGAFSRKAT